MNIHVIGCVNDNYSINYNYSCYSEQVFTGDLEVLQTSEAISADGKRRISADGKEDTTSLQSKYLRL